MLFVLVGICFYILFTSYAFFLRDDELVKLMDGKYMGIGLSKSVKVLEGDDGKCCPFVVADGSHIAFYVHFYLWFNFVHFNIFQ